MTVPTIAVSDIPDRAREFVKWQTTPILQMFPVVDTLQTYILRGGVDENETSALGSSIREQ